MPRILVIRHGEPARAWGEGDDPGLSDIGCAQADGAARVLKSMALAQIVTSPMRRCRQTAAAFEANAGLVSRIEPRVSEIAAPPGVSDRRAWLAKTFPWREGEPPTFWDDLDVSMRNWRGAVIAAALEIDSDTAIFTHFVAINVLIGAAQGESRTIVARPAFASIAELQSENGVLRLVAFGAQMRQGLVT